MKRKKALLGLLGALVLTGMDCAETKNVTPPADDASADAAEDASLCGDCSDGTPYCDAASETCVACLETPQCGNAEASRCEAGACVACEGDSDCEHVAGKGRCAAGACVECTTTTEEEDCGTKACNPATKACGTIDRGTQGNCEPCEADSECGEFGGTLRCVPMEFQEAPNGSYCLVDKATAAGMACPRQYPDPLVTESVGGTAATYCSPIAALTTCEAVLGFKDTCATDADCGEGGLSDGLCRDDGAGLKCTYECQGSDDCANGANCSTDLPKYCCTASGGPGCD